MKDPDRRVVVRAPARWCRTARRALLAAGLALTAWAGARAEAPHAPSAPPAATVAAAAPATLALHNRRIVELRATLLSDTPAERAAMARAAIDAALAAGGPGEVGRSNLGDAVRLEIDGRPVFFLVEGDLTEPRAAALLDTAGLKAQARLAQAVQEAREMGQPRLLAIGAAWAAAATAVALLLLRGLLGLRHRIQAALAARLERWQASHPGHSIVGTYAPHGHAALQGGTTVLVWALLLLLADLWATFVLRQFAYTRPWGERATEWLLELGQQFALGIAGAVPGLLTVLLILLIARAVTRLGGLLLERVERGELRLRSVDADMAAPTRRIGQWLVWLFALALAYPYLPGASSESFKGVTVLAGLMVSLGASGVVGQAMAGLSLMYSRALRPGEYVRVGEVEGTVMRVGMLATKIHTGIGEEVSLPNAVVIGHAVRNFSRLAPEG
ncbi:MAG: mechanosensitive ion channel domain-containing protein, partial [Aquabacterium sp.]